MDIQTLKSIQLNTFTPLGSRGVIVYLIKEPVCGFDLSISPLDLDAIGNIHINDICLGEDGVHIGYLFKVPACAKSYHNSVVIPRPSSDEELLQAESFLVADIPGLLIYANEQGSILILSDVYQNNITRNL